jgi:hypothetical protein
MSIRNDYDPARQVSTADMEVARDVVRRLAEGGEPLTRLELAIMLQAQSVLDWSIEHRAAS